MESLGWPAAVSMIVGFSIIVGGLLRYVSLKTGGATLSHLVKELDAIKDRLIKVEGGLIAVDASVEGKISIQITDLKAEMRSLNSKMDTVVREVVSAVTASR